MIYYIIIVPFAGMVFGLGIVIYDGIDRVLHEL
jgi:hypothetical protein